MTSEHAETDGTVPIEVGLAWHPEETTPTSADEEPFIPKEHYRPAKSTKILACAVLVMAGLFGGALVQKALAPGQAGNRGNFSQLRTGGQGNGADTTNGQGATGTPTRGARGTQNSGFGAGTGGTAGGGTAGGGAATPPSGP